MGLDTLNDVHRGSVPRSLTSASFPRYATCGLACKHRPYSCLSLAILAASCHCDHFLEPLQLQPYSMRVTFQITLLSLLLLERSSALAVLTEAASTPVQVPRMLVPLPFYLPANAGDLVKRVHPQLALILGSQPSSTFEAGPSKKATTPILSS